MHSSFFVKMVLVCSYLLSKEKFTCDDTRVRDNASALILCQRWYANSSLRGQNFLVISLERETIHVHTFVFSLPIGCQVVLATRSVTKTFPCFKKASSEPNNMEILGR